MNSEIKAAQENLVHDNPGMQENQSAGPDVWCQSALTEDLALALLKRRDLAPENLERLSKNGGLADSHKVKLALAIHPRTPRHVSLPLLRHLFTFELMQVALSAPAPADIRVAAEESLISKLETISSGQKLSLARRASGRVAAALLLDAEPRVMEVALENSHLTEALITRILQSRGAPAGLVQAVTKHSKWSLRRDVRLAVLGNENTPLDRALEFAHTLPPSMVTEVIQMSNLSGDVKSMLLRKTEQRLTDPPETKPPETEQRNASGDASRESSER